MDAITSRLFQLQDLQYAAFQSKLTPNVDPKLFIGVRVPECRKLARELIRDDPEAVEAFLNELPHVYYDENMLHGLLISENRDFDGCIKQVRAFLPQVDNWAVCDIMSPKCFRKHKAELLPLIREWLDDPHEYTVRFALEMLMTHYLDDGFDKTVLEMASAVRSDYYYVNMMVAWFFATALTKQWDSAIGFLEHDALDVWVHNKTIQKARESYRITPEQKAYLASRKRT